MKVISPKERGVNTTRDSSNAHSDARVRYKGYLSEVKDLINNISRFREDIHLKSIPPKHFTDSVNVLIIFLESNGSVKAWKRAINQWVGHRLNDHGRLTADKVVALQRSEQNILEVFDIIHEDFSSSVRNYLASLTNLEPDSLSISSAEHYRQTGQLFYSTANIIEGFDSLKTETVEYFLEIERHRAILSLEQERYKQEKLEREEPLCKEKKLYQALSQIFTEAGPPPNSEETRLAESNPELDRFRQEFLAEIKGPKTCSSSADFGSNTHGAESSEKSTAASSSSKSTPEAMWPNQLYRFVASLMVRREENEQTTPQTIERTNASSETPSQASGEKVFHDTAVKALFENSQLLKAAGGRRLTTLTIMQEDLNAKAYASEKYEFVNGMWKLQKTVGIVDRPEEQDDEDDAEKRISFTVKKAVSKSRPCHD